MPDLMSPDQIEAARTDVPHWEVSDGTTLVRTVTADSFTGGIRLVDRVAAAAEEMNHHPDIDIRWTDVTFRLSTHYLGGLTENDFALAATIDRLAAAGG